MAAANKRVGPRYHKLCNARNTIILDQPKWRDLTQYLMHSTETAKKPCLRSKDHAPEKGPCLRIKDKTETELPNK